jgi:hypothetical protein
MARRGPKTIDPTPQEIERRTKQIRAAWSERTHRIRSGWSVEAADKMDQWTAPVIRTSELRFDERDDETHWWN